MVEYNGSIKLAKSSIYFFDNMTIPIFDQKEISQGEMNLNLKM